MSAKLQWITGLAADARFAPVAVRMAVALAGLSDERGRFTGRALDLADAAQCASRHIKDHLERLARFQYLRILSAPKGGRLSVAILTPVPDGIDNSTGKAFVEIEGHVVATIVPKRPAGLVHLYVEGARQLTKISLSRSEAHVIATALSAPPGRVGADQGSAAL